MVAFAVSLSLARNGKGSASAKTQRRREKEAGVVEMLKETGSTRAVGRV